MHVFRWPINLLHVLIQYIHVDVRIYILRQVLQNRSVLYTDLLEPFNALLVQCLLLLLS